MVEGRLAYSFVFSRRRVNDTEGSYLLLFFLYDFLMVFFRLFWGFFPSVSRRLERLVLNFLTVFLPFLPQLLFLAVMVLVVIVTVVAGSAAASGSGGGG